MDDLKYQLDLLTAINEKLIYSKNIYRMIAEMTEDLYLYINYKNGNIFEFIGPWDERLGERISSHPFDETYMINFIADDDYDDFKEKIIDMRLRNEEKSSVIFKTKKKKTWFRADAYIKYDSDNNPVEKIISFKDISKERTQNEELEYLAYYDSLTGLYNRNCFVTKLRDLCDKADKEKNTVELLFIDIDNFKNINDSLGLLMGDELVQNFAIKLKEFTFDNAIIGRFGSDVFCVAIYEPCGQKSATALFKRIQMFLRTPFKLTNGKDVSFTVSGGVTCFPDAGKTALELIRNTEIVLYKAKDKGKNNLEYFRYDMLNTFIKNVSMEQKIKAAIENDEFVVYFQPIFIAENTKKIRGAEALVRWPDGNGGFVSSPAEFIPICESTGMIHQVGDYVLNKTIQSVAIWHEKYNIPLTVSINISPVQIKKDDFVDHINNICSKYNVMPEWIEIELTENVFVEDKIDIAQKINTLRKIGFKIALDDFGTGYSSLSYLKDISIDTLKIDKSFVDTMLVSNATSVITESVIGMVKNLGLDTVAEGVERVEQFDFLNSRGCNYIQGYYLGKPVNENEFERILIRQLP